MKVKVISSLQVRVGKPSLQAPTYQQLAPGSELEVEDAIFQGDTLHQDNRWLRDAAGNYYWIGGTNYDEIKDWQTDEGELSRYLHLKEIWNKVRGRQVGVAVVDTGIDLNNPELVYDRTKFYRYNGSFDLADHHGHGSHCAGLIGAKNRMGKYIGVAPECNLYICKIADRSYLKIEELNRYAEAIRWCTSQEEIHIISISWGSIIQDVGVKQDLQMAINQAVQNNKLVVCAMGDAYKINDPSEFMPACLNNTIGVGAIPVQGKLYPFINEFLFISTLGFEVTSFGKTGEYLCLSGTSQATAIVAGLIALLIEKRNYQYNLASIKRDLMNFSTDHIYENIQMKVIDPQKLKSFFTLNN
jgi:subtilisin family serine protease